MVGLLEGLGVLAIALLAVLLLTVVCIFGMALFVILKVFSQMEW